MYITPEYNLIPAKEKVQTPEIDYQMGDKLGGQVLGSDARYWGSGEEVGVMDENGLYLGSTDYTTAPFYASMAGDVTATSITITGGTIDGTSTIDGRTASVLADAIDASGHFADDAISTADGTILGEFVFTGSGALQIGTYVNGASGDLRLSPSGILARGTDGLTTFSINGETGVAVLNGLVVGTNVGIGTAEDSAGVTTIVGDVVTTGYVNALEVTAEYVAASIAISSPTITSGIIRTAASGARVQMSGTNNRLELYNASGVIGYLGNIGGSDGSFLYINQPDTNADNPPFYITSAQDSNAMNMYCTHAGLANRPAFRFESSNDSSEAMYIVNSSNTMPTLGLTQNGTGYIIGTNVAGCYLDKAGTWNDASSKTIKENFEEVIVLDKLKNLDVLKYNYIVDGLPKTKKTIKFKEKKDDNRKGGGTYNPINQSKIRKHVSPMAEDFYKTFGLGDDKGISAKDLAGIALQAIKELSKKVEELEKKYETFT